MPVTSNAFIAEKLDFIASQMQSLSDKLDSFRQVYVVEHQAVVGAAQRAHERIDRLESDLQKLTTEQREIMRMMPFIKAQSYMITGLAVPFVVAVVGFVWALITHKVQFIP